MIRIASILLAALLPFEANAQPAFLESYLHPKDGTDRIIARTYLEGLRDGLVSYNAMIAEKRYCMPEGIVLTDELADAAILGWVKKQTKNTSDLPPHIANFPVAVALISGLEETFPCRK
jgi:hypothetical protein